MCTKYNNILSRLPKAEDVGNALNDITEYRKSFEYFTAENTGVTLDAARRSWITFVAEQYYSNR